jgi:hypothetical protein
MRLCGSKSYVELMQGRSATGSYTASLNQVFSSPQRTDGADTIRVRMAFKRNGREDRSSRPSASNGK